MSGERIPVTAETKEAIKWLKRGGDTYDGVLRKMVMQYEPRTGEPPTDEQLKERVDSQQ